MAFPGPPISQENLDQVKEDAEEFLKEFSIKLLLGYGETMFEKVRLEQEGPQVKKWKLSRRELSDAPRTNLYMDYIWIMMGAGAGDFDGWKKFYMVERQDYQLDLYKDDKAYKSKKKPTETIQPIGYKLVTENVAGYYDHQFRTIAEGIGLSGAQAESLTVDMSPVSWALAHPFRKNYIFQVKKGTNSGGGCCRSSTVQPGEGMTESEEEAKQHQAAVDCLKKCQRSCQPRDKNSILSLSFGVAWGRMNGKFTELQGFKDDGSEAEILADLVMQVCITRQRDQVLKNLTGPDMIKVKLWYKAQRLMMVALTKILEIAWGLAQKGVEEVQKKVEPTLKQGIGKVLEVKKTIEGKVKGTVQDPLGKAMAQYVTPFIKPFLEAFEKPLKTSFDNGRVYLTEVLVLQELSAEKTKRNSSLDALVGDAAKRVCEPLTELSQTVGKLRTISVGDFSIFEGLDVEAVTSQAEQEVLQAIDSVVFTIQERLDAGQSADSIVETALKEYDYDVIVARGEFMKDIVWTTMFSMFKRATAPVIDPAIESFNSLVPQEVSSVLNIEKIIDDIITFLVREPIDKAIGAAYPLPK